MPKLILEIHVPLVPCADGRRDQYQYPWIDTVEEFLAEAEETRSFEVYDDGEELGDDYLFFITGQTEGDLLEIASDVARLDSVPPGTYALVNEEGNDMGTGRRVDLPIS